MSSGKKRLDVALAQRGLVASRSQAESYIKLGKVKVNGKILNKSSILVSQDDVLEIRGQEQYVSRAALKLESVAKRLGVDFKAKVVLDVGSSTGGFTDYALKRGAAKVVAVDVGTDQLHPSLRTNKRVELHEKTDILEVGISNLESGEKQNQNSKFPIPNSRPKFLIDTPDIILVDVSFVSLRKILPHITSLSTAKTLVVAMVKPQFEAGPGQVNKGVIKNDSIRRQILKDFENWSKDLFVIKAKADSQVAGAKGNLERFYLLYKR